jgi:hypothetical protein
MTKEHDPMNRETAFPKTLAFILASLIFLAVNVAQAQEAKIEKVYKGTLTGSVQYHSENKKLPYWLKVENSTYGIVIGDNAESKALLDEFLGTRMSLTGTIQEFKNGSLAIVVDKPIKRPAPNPALSMVKKAMAKDKGFVILEEFLLKNGWYVYLAGRRTNGPELCWAYKLYSAKWKFLTSTGTFGYSSLTYYDNMIIVSMDNDTFTLSCPRHTSGKDLVELSLYRNGIIYRENDIESEKDEQCTNVTVTGIVVDGSYSFRSSS